MGRTRACGRPKKNPLPDESGFRLASLGLTYAQSHRWQTMAELAECEIDAIAAEATESSHADRRQELWLFRGALR